MTSPEKYSDIKAAKKAKKTTLILVCVIAAIILASVALIIFSETGALARGKVLYESENFEINGAMATYMYMNVYQQYYSMYGQYAQYFMSSDVTTLIGAKTILARCEAAKAAGYELTDADLEEINETVKEIKASCKENGYSLSEMYGDGVTAKDIKDVLKLQKLASKIYEDKETAFTDKILADTNRINKYFEENKSDFIKGDYFKVSVADEETIERLVAAGSEEDFKKIFIEYYVNKNLLTNYNSKTEEDVDALDKSVFKTVSAIVAYYLCETPIEGYSEDLEEFVDIDEIEVSDEVFGNIYAVFKEDADTTDETMYENLGKTAAEMCDKVNKAITVKSNYAYPDDSSSSSTTTTTTAATTTSKPSTEEKPEGEGEGEGEESEDDEKDTPTASELADAFDEWFFDEERKDNDIYAAEDGKTVYFVTKAATKETYLTKNVGHILVKVDNVKDAAAMAEAKKKAQSILDQFLAGAKTKDAFETLANENTDDGGVFYDNVIKGKMVEAFENWIYDEARKAGDTGIVETEYGYHVMYFVGDGVEAWTAGVLEELLSDDLTTWNTEITTTYPVTVNDKNVKKIFG